MIKKILFSIGVLFSFFLMFLLGFDKINVLAYSDIGNALGSYPIKLDIDNYDNVNLISDNDIDYRTGVLTPYLNVIDVKSFTFNANTTYTFKIFEYESTSTAYQLYFTEKLNVNGAVGCAFWNTNSNFKSCTIGSEDITLSNEALIKISSGNISNTKKLMIVEGDIVPEYYSPFFEFGYYVNYSLSVNNLTNNQVSAGIAITDENGNYLKTGNCVIPASSSTICNNLNDPLYLPFNIDNNGYISFNHSLGLFIGPVGSLSVTPIDSGFNFVPVFNAYYNGSATNNLYFKDRYTFNNLFFSGFNVSVNSSTLSKITFPRNQFDSEYSMNTNKIINFATDKKIQTGIYNYINYVDFISSSPSYIYSFVLTTGVSNPTFFENRIYTISFSNLSLKVNGDTGNVSPLPNNPNTINKYNECSAWYDIPCQLGNAVTYVIYEAPIISPVLTFIVSFITMFSSLVSFVDLFRSFGIAFGCFIIYMFIELLHKYSK